MMIRMKITQLHRSLLKSVANYVCPIICYRQSKRFKRQSLISRWVHIEQRSPETLPSIYRPIYRLISSMAVQCELCRV